MMFDGRRRGPGASSEFGLFVGLPWEPNAGSLQISPAAGPPELGGFSPGMVA